MDVTPPNNFHPPSVCIEFLRIDSRNSVHSSTCTVVSSAGRFTSHFIPKIRLSIIPSSMLERLKRAVSAVAIFHCERLLTASS